jgi:hypothetical protein
VPANRVSNGLGCTARGSAQRQRRKQASGMPNRCRADSVAAT